MTRSRSQEKDRIRREVWDRLEEEELARFPYPPHGRIPNFAGAEDAAARLFEAPLPEGLEDARRIKVNPDAPQRFVRAEALRRGIEVFVPTPRLRAGFRCLDPARIPAAKRQRAASLAGAARHGREVALEELPELDAAVVGSVAVCRRGHRLGKGEGYADLEYGILRSLGHPPLPVVTTVHPVQVVASLPRDPTDLPISLIVTPEERFRVSRPPRAPEGIDWSRLGEDDLRAMPVLRRLRELAAGED